MRKLAFLIAALSLAGNFSAMAHDDTSRDHSAMQHIGGHYRHMHRDWSQDQGRHVHNVCWQWDIADGWIWTCR
jgi:hypothetical protein